MVTVLVQTQGKIIFLEVDLKDGQLPGEDVIMNILKNRGVFNRSERVVNVVARNPTTKSNPS